jgi:hypothetical protein
MDNIFISYNRCKHFCLSVLIKEHFGFDAYAWMEQV